MANILNPASVSGIGFDKTQINPNQGRRVIHQLPKNPMDKSTIVSICPQPINEFKPTIFPGRFHIPAAAENDYVLFTVEPSSFYMPNQNEKQPPMEVQLNSMALAESIVQDYLRSCYLNGGDRGPGIFYILGAWSKSMAAKNYIEKYVREDGVTFAELLAAARERQKNWFQALIEEADANWANTGGNPRAIDPIARIAAVRLSLDKAWAHDFKAISKVKCKSCGELIDGEVAVCRFCHAIVDPIKAKELGIQFATR